MQNISRILLSFVYLSILSTPAFCIYAFAYFSPLFLFTRLFSPWKIIISRNKPGVIVDFTHSFFLHHYFVLFLLCSYCLRRAQMLVENFLS